MGIDYEFNDFIQAVHRIYRFLQTEQVVIDIILTENEEGILDVLLKKWQQHNYLTKKMTDIIKKYGLSNANTSQLERKLGVERVQVNGITIRQYLTIAWKKQRICRITVLI